MDEISIAFIKFASSFIAARQKKRVNANMPAISLSFERKEESLNYPYHRLRITVLPGDIEYCIRKIKVPKFEISDCIEIQITQLNWIVRKTDVLPSNGFKWSSEQEFDIVISPQKFYQTSVNGVVKEGLTAIQLDLWVRPIRSMKFLDVYVYPSWGQLCTFQAPMLSSHLPLLEWIFPDDLIG